MKITERKEVTHTQIDEIVIGRKCDVCKRNIKIDEFNGHYNYFKIHTWHNDWGNDSIDSHDYFDACCPECVIKFTEKYIKDAFENPLNSRQIEIKHSRCL